MSDPFEVVQNTEACAKHKERRDSDNYPIWTSALYGWDHGCRDCFVLIQPLLEFRRCGGIENGIQCHYVSGHAGQHHFIEASIKKAKPWSGLYPDSAGDLLDH